MGSTQLTGQILPPAERHHASSSHRSDAPRRTTQLVKRMIRRYRKPREMGKQGGEQLTVTAPWLRPESAPAQGEAGWRHWEAARRRAGAMLWARAGADAGVAAVWDLVHLTGSLVRQWPVLLAREEREDRQAGGGAAEETTAMWRRIRGRVAVFFFLGK